MLLPQVKLFYRHLRLLVLSKNFVTLIFDAFTWCTNFINVCRNGWYIIHWDTNLLNNSYRSYRHSMFNDNNSKVVLIYWGKDGWAPILVCLKRFEFRLYVQLIIYTVYMCMYVPNSYTHLEIMFTHCHLFCSSPACLTRDCLPSLCPLSLAFDSGYYLLSCSCQWIVMDKETLTLMSYNVLHSPYYVPCSSCSWWQWW